MVFPTEFHPFFLSKGRCYKQAKKNMKKLIIIASILICLPAFALAAPSATTTPDVIVKSVSVNGASWTNWIARINFVNYWNRNISWLSTHFSEGKVICSQESNKFALDMFGHPFNYTSVNSFMSINPMNKTSYGYKNYIELYGNEGKWTYHSIKIPDWFKGTYFCRAISTINGVEMISNELKIDVK